MNTEELLTQLRTKFADWFDDYGFRIVHYQTGRNDDIQVGLESTFCRLSVEQEDGILVIMIGAPTAVFGENEPVEGVKQWVNLERIADFVEQRPFDWTVDDRITESSAKLNYLEQKIHPSWSTILPMFRDIATIKTWYQKFRNYSTEQIQRI